MTDEMTEPANELSLVFQAMRDHLISWGLDREDVIKMDVPQIRETYEFMKSITE